jgi:hypothetical protein
MNDVGQGWAFVDGFGKLRVEIPIVCSGVR